MVYSVLSVVQWQFPGSFQINIQWFRPFFTLSLVLGWPITNLKCSKFVF